MIIGLKDAIRNKRRIIFIDEVIFISKDSKIKSLSQIGTNINASFTGKFQNNTFLIAAIDLNSLIYYEILEG